MTGFEGLESLGNLSDLYLQNNKITDLSSLKAVLENTRLSQLDLRANEVTAIGDALDAMTGSLDLLETRSCVPRSSLLKRIRAEVFGSHSTASVKWIPMVMVSLIREMHSLVILPLLLITTLTGHQTSGTKVKLRGLDYGPRRGR